MEPAESFGSWLRHRRKILDMTQADLARCAGCATGTLKHIEQEERRASRDLAARLAECLQVPAEQREAFIRAVRSQQSPDWSAQSLEPDRSAVSPTTSTSNIARHSLPSGTLTFLFTDIEGSTRLWEQYGEDMSLALARHETILRHEIGIRGGIVFKTVGDAVLAVFTDAFHALTATIAAQSSLFVENWAPLRGLHIRMALLTGIAQARGGDYIGPTLNRAARLVESGHGGQILISLATEELVRGHLPPNIVLRDLGLHSLRDLAHPEHIFQVVAPGLPDNFPALKTLEGRRLYLPTQTTPFIGRAREVAQVQNLLQRNDARLVTLTGPGGVGKTRLALQVATEMLDTMHDSAYFVPLGTITDSAFVLSAVIQSLGIREIGTLLPLDLLKVHLRDRKLLLVLDNFEQILASAPLVSELLAAAAHLKILVTSRAPLHLSGEHVVIVPPLALPDPVKRITLQQLLQYPAVQLFIARAQAVNANFTATTENAAALVGICERLDGLPLAIELAAARIQLFSPELLLTRLNNPFQLLTDGAHDTPQRHRTLQSSIEWSYQLLGADEQILFRRLAVFVGSCTLEAVEAVCDVNGDLSIGIFDGVTALINKSLLQRVDGLNSGYRLKMLETIREYALAQLAANREVEAMRQRSAEYFLDLAETAEQALHVLGQTNWLHRLDADHDNFRMVLGWSLIDGQQVELGLRLASALWHFWEIRGHLTEGQTWLGRLLALGAKAPPALRAKALYGLASLTSDPMQATVMLEEALALHHSAGNQVGIVATLQRLGAMAAFQGDYEKASNCLEESLDGYRTLGDTIGIAAVLHSLGDIARYRRAYDRALTLQYESLCLRCDIGNEHGVAWSLNNLAWIAYDLGQQSQAALLHQASYDLFCEVGDRWGIAAALTNLGHIARQQGDHERAVQCLTTGLEHFRTLNNPGAIAYVLEHLAVLAATTRRGSEEALRAARLFGAAQALRDASNSPVPPFDLIEYRKNVAYAQSYIDADDWSAAYAGGQATPTDEVYKEVLTQASWLKTDVAISPSRPIQIMAGILPAPQSVVAADVLRIVVRYVATRLPDAQVSYPTYNN